MLQSDSGGHLANYTESNKVKQQIYFEGKKTWPFCAQTTGIQEKTQQIIVFIINNFGDYFSS